MNKELKMQNTRRINTSFVIVKSNTKIESMIRMSDIGYFINQ